MLKKKIQVTLPVVKEEEKTLWQKIKDKFYNSGTIMSAWIKGVVGAVGTAVVGISSSIDWSHPLALLQQGVSLTKESWLMIGGATFLLGVVDYFTRTSGTKAVEGHLLPKAE